MIDLEAIKKRCESATPGPWTVTGTRQEWYNVWAEGKWILCEGIQEHDAEFIAAARQDIPALAEEVERLRAENKDQAATIALQSAELRKLRAENANLTASLASLAALGNHGARLERYAAGVDGTGEYCQECEKYKREGHWQVCPKADVPE